MSVHHSERAGVASRRRMGRGGWRDAKDRRPHVAVLVVLLGTLTALVGLAPVAIGGYSTTCDYPTSDPAAVDRR